MISTKTKLIILLIRNEDVWTYFKFGDFQISSLIHYSKLLCTIVYQGFMVNYYPLLIIQIKVLSRFDWNSAEHCGTRPSNAGSGSHSAAGPAPVPWHSPSGNFPDSCTSFLSIYIVVIPAFLDLPTSSVSARANHRGPAAQLHLPASQCHRRTQCRLEQRSSSSQENPRYDSRSFRHYLCQSPGWSTETG